MWRSHSSYFGGKMVTNTGLFLFVCLFLFFILTEIASLQLLGKRSCSYVGCARRCQLKVNCWQVTEVSPPGEESRRAGAEGALLRFPSKQRHQGGLNRRRARQRAENPAEGKSSCSVRDAWAKHPLWPRAKLLPLCSLPCFFTLTPSLALCGIFRQA